MIELLQSKFNQVYRVKPEASRKDSAEIYHLATGFNKL
jgi:23S rRNA U2552 (ribose-2'-O)-methylase RlmE/FtsJ